MGCLTGWSRWHAVGGKATSAIDATKKSRILSTENTEVTETGKERALRILAPNVFSSLCVLCVLCVLCGSILLALDCSAGYAGLHDLLGLSLGLAFGQFDGTQLTYFGFGASAVAAGN